MWQMSSFWKSTALLGGSALLSRILGLVRDHLLATNFGALTGTGIYDLDVYYAAFRLPDILYNLLIYGTLSSAFVPIFVSYWKKGDIKKAVEFTSNVFTLALFSILVLCLIAFFAAPLILPLLVPGFSGEKLGLTVMATRLMLIAPVFFTISGIFQSVQNSLGRFFWYSVGPIAYNAGIIVGIIFLSWSWGIFGVAGGVVLGSFLHAVTQLPTLRYLPVRMKIFLNWARNDMKEMFKLMIPRIIGLSLSQFNLVVDTIIGSTLITGSITILNYATNINQVPIGIIAISAAIVSFSTLSALATNEEKKEFCESLKTNIHRILWLMIPATVGMVVLRFQIVRLVLGRGKFGWEDTIFTSNTLGLLALGLISHSLIFLLARAFYAWKNTKTPLFVGIVAFASNITISIVLTKIFNFGVYGLAISNAISAILNMSGLLILLKYQLNVPMEKFLDYKILGKYVIAALVMGLFVQATKQFFGQVFDDIDTYLEIGIQTLSAVAIGIVVYFASLKGLDLKSKRD